MVNASGVPYRRSIPVKFGEKVELLSPGEPQLLLTDGGTGTRKLLPQDETKLRLSDGGAGTRKQLPPGKTKTLIIKDKNGDVKVLQVDGGKSQTGEVIRQNGALDNGGAGAGRPGSGEDFVGQRAGEVGIKEEYFKGKSSEPQIGNTETLFTQGSKIPKKILMTKPLYSPDVNRWLEGGGEIVIENGTWKYVSSEGISVTYRNGYPDFKGSGLVIQEVDIGSFSDRPADFRLGDKLAPNGPRGSCNTWHHHEDGRTLQEVNRRIHEMFCHRGGVSIKKRKR